MKILSLKIIVFVCLLSFIIFLPSRAVLAAELSTDYLFGGGKLTAEELAGHTGLGISDPREVAANIINIILGFLGIIAVILILFGGFMWMTAAGNDDKIGTAKKLMSAGVIGLVIVLAAFGIAKFVISSMLSATGGDSVVQEEPTASGESEAPVPPAITPLSNYARPASLPQGGGTQDPTITNLDITIIP